MLTYTTAQPRPLIARKKCIHRAGGMGEILLVNCSLSGRAYSNATRLWESLRLKGNAMANGVMRPPARLML